MQWAAGVAPHFPGFLRTVDPNVQVSTGASHMYYLTSITGFAISKSKPLCGSLY